MLDCFHEAPLLGAERQQQQPSTGCMTANSTYQVCKMALKTMTFALILLASLLMAVKRCLALETDSLHMVTGVD
jgi:hypothetical protein